MNTTRMFAFVAAVLITAFLLRMIVDGFAVKQRVHSAAAAAAAAVRPQSSRD
jgi:hypothetical protein